MVNGHRVGKKELEINPESQDVKQDIYAGMQEIQISYRLTARLIF
jgi:hypothetical protein